MPLDHKKPIPDSLKVLLISKKSNLVGCLRNLNGVLVHLESALILNDWEIAEIKAGKTDNDKIDKLISYLCKGSEAGFYKFRDALKKVGQFHLAELLLITEQQETRVDEGQNVLQVEQDGLNRYLQTMESVEGDGGFRKGENEAHRSRSIKKMKCVVDLVFPDNSEPRPDLSGYLTDIHRRRFIKDNPLVDILDSVEPINERGFNILLDCQNYEDFQLISILHSTDELADVLKKMFFVDVLERSELLSGVEFKATIPKDEFKRVIKAISKQPKQGDDNNN